ncbi:hypothetical protein [Shewanella algae]|uniref:hypothetical protein n=1 Tax=Shewanella algae TaxID=38313 RepID=UPI001C585790|nr:hypothetical protein [Shewanella algae]
MTDKNCPVILVCSPFQILCAAEAVNLEVKSSVRLIVLRTQCVNNDSQVDKLVDYYDDLWSSVNYVRMKGREGISIIKYLYDLFLLKLNLWNTDEIYIGDPRVRTFQLISNLLIHKKATFLDDGLGALGYGIFLEKLKQECNESKIKSIFYGYRGISLRSIFYSELIDNNVGFELEYKQCDIVKFLKDSHQFKSDLKGHYFIGQKLVDNGFLTLSEYIFRLKGYVDKIKEKFNSEVIYISHRGESESTISKVESLKNIKVVKLELPIEVYLSFNGVVPVSVASFYSTALITLSMIYKDLPVKFFSLDIPYNISITENEHLFKNIKNAYQLIGKFNVESLKYDS